MPGCRRLVRQASKAGSPRTFRCCGVMASSRCESNSADRPTRSRLCGRRIRTQHQNFCLLRVTGLHGQKSRGAFASSSMHRRRMPTYLSYQASRTKSSSTTSRTSVVFRLCSVTSTSSRAHTHYALRTTCVLNTRGSSRRGCNGGFAILDHPTSGSGTSDRNSRISGYSMRFVSSHLTFRSRCGRSARISSKEAMS